MAIKTRETRRTDTAKIYEMNLMYNCLINIIKVISLSLGHLPSDKLCSVVRFVERLATQSIHFAK